MVSTETLVVLLIACADLRLLRSLHAVQSLTMRHAYRHTPLFCLAAAALCLSGCTSFSDYFHHGFKVGPEYCGAKAAVAPEWIDATDIRIRSHAADLSRWWCVFNDPVLNDLVYHAYNQNINLKEYGTRILQARYTLAIAKGEVFPQTQNATGSYSRMATPASRSFSPAFPSSTTSGTSASTWPGSWISGANSAAPCWRPMPNLTPRWRTTTPCWSRC